MKYDCIIIGAGMGGLASALKLAASGKKVLVLEGQPVPGGLGTSFKRKGFVFESALHIVDSLGPGGAIRNFLDEHDVSPKMEFIELEGFGRVVYPEHDFTVNNDFASLENWLGENFPQEKEGIGQFFRDIGKFYRQFDRFDNSKIPFCLKLLFSPVFYPLIIKASCLTFEQFITKKIEDRKLRAIIGTLWGFLGSAPSELSAFYFLIVLRLYWNTKTAYIKGGFSKLFNALVERIRELGSEVKFNTQVREIITDAGKRVKGVRTDKGEEFSAGVVISNANAIDTLTRLIDSAPLKEAYAEKLIPMRKTPSAVIIYIGLNIPAGAIGMDYPFLSINTSYDHDASFRRCLSSELNHCSLAAVNHSQLDPDLAPPGKSTLCVMTLAKYADWENLTVEQYQEKKKKAAEAIVAQLEKYLPGVSGHIEVLEVGTPKTMERFACLPEGSIYGFAQTPAQSGLNRLSQETKIKGLFLTGAWTRPGCGIHACMVSGKEAAALALQFLKKSRCA